jgi:salicylate hydroxylase
MAIEDAAVLARHLSAGRHDPVAALAAYEAERRPRVRRVWKAAETTADLYHMGLLTGAVRNAGMRFLGGRALLSRYGWIYRWSPDG